MKEFGSTHYAIGHIIELDGVCLKGSEMVPRRQIDAEAAMQASNAVLVCGLPAGLLLPRQSGGKRGCLRYSRTCRSASRKLNRYLSGASGNS
jgi:hypothetical protein